MAPLHRIKISNSTHKQNMIMYKINEHLKFGIAKYDGKGMWYTSGGAIDVIYWSEEPVL